MVSSFHAWYKENIAPRIHGEQASYERDSVAFSAIESLSKEEILHLYETMDLATLRLAFFDHVRRCMDEQWTPEMDSEWDEA